ncbi:hypothetical protein ACFV23_15055 [Streptomyces sp. NPDC059627]
MRAAAGAARLAQTGGDFVTRARAVGPVGKVTPETAGQAAREQGRPTRHRSGKPDARIVADT